MLKLTLRISILFLFFLPLACQINNDVLISPEPTNSISVEEAQNWFENSFLSSPNARIADADNFHRVADWRYAHTINFSSKQQIVVVPLVHLIKGRYSGFKQLWVYKNKKGQNTLRVIEYLSNFDIPSQNGYSIQNFTGAFLIKDWDDNVLGGFDVKNNKIVGVISEFGYGKPKKNGRTATLLCSLAQSCQLYYHDSGAMVGSSDPNGSSGYFYWSCTSDYTCVWTMAQMSDIPQGEDQGTIPYDPGAITTTADPLEIKYHPKQFDNPCKGMTEMQGFQESIVDKEVHGIITTDGLLFILPNYANTYNESKWLNTFENQDGKTTVKLYQDFNVPGPAPLYIEVFAAPDYKKSKKYQVSTMVHTHPCSAGLSAANTPSTCADCDYGVADRYFMVKHILLGCTKMVEFNSTQILNISPLPFCP